MTSNSVQASSSALISGNPNTQRRYAVQLERVTKHRGDKLVLNGIDLKVREGEVLALLGANGAGKSTLVKLLLGLLRPSEGTVQVFGKPPTIAQHRARTGVMLQQNALPHNLTVEEVLNLFRSYYPKPLPLEKVLALTGLDDLRRRQVHRLSGGQQRRVAFAVALSGDPDLLILDEPTVGLDFRARRTLWQHIRTFAKAGTAVLLTTHYLEEAEVLADQVVLLHQGEIVAQGTTSELKELATNQCSKGQVAATDSNAVTNLEQAFLSLTEASQGETSPHA